MGRKEGRKAAFPRFYWQARDEFDYKMEWAYDVQVEQYTVEVLSLSRWNTFLGRKEGRKAAFPRFYWQGRYEFDHKILSDCGES